jgi:uncharacterized protein
MTIDLTNADLDVLDHLLAQTPAPLQPLDAVMLDGYLAGIAVQPKVMPIDTWLAGVFDLQARPLPADHDPAWLAQCRALIERRFEVMTTELSEDAWFDPVIVDVAELPPLSEYETPLPATTRTLAPWIAGFQLALLHHPDLRARGDREIDAALARVEKHGFPNPQGDDTQATPSAVASVPSSPAKQSDEATDAEVSRAVVELVSGVADLWALTDAERYRVDTVRRSVPKVGRNDPCPCGSQRKYKVCHGAAA